jgi:hypothetical protein
VTRAWQDAGAPGRGTGAAGAALGTGHDPSPKADGCPGPGATHAHCSRLRPAGRRAGSRAASFARGDDRGPFGRRPAETRGRGDDQGRGEGRPAGGAAPRGLGGNTRDATGPAPTHLPRGRRRRPRGRPEAPRPSSCAAPPRPAPRASGTLWAPEDRASVALRRGLSGDPAPGDTGAAGPCPRRLTSHPKSPPKSLSGD